MSSDDGCTSWSAHVFELLQDSRAALQASVDLVDSLRTQLEALPPDHDATASGLLHGYFPFPSGGLDFFLRLLEARAQLQLAEAELARKQALAAQLVARLQDLQAF